MLELDIINGCKRKDEKAYRQCYEACAPYVYSIIKNYISDDDYRRDAMQEVFSQIFLSIDRYDSSLGKFKSWIAQITIYQCVTLLRKRNRISMIIPLEPGVEVADMNELLDPLSKEEIEKLLHTMPEGYKTVFLLNVIDGYKHKEIADMLGITISSSRSQLSRAIKWIKNNLSCETKNYIYG